MQTAAPGVEVVQDRWVDFLLSLIVGLLDADLEYFFGVDQLDIRWLRSLIRQQCFLSSGIFALSDLWRIDRRRWPASRRRLFRPNLFHLRIRNPLIRNPGPA